MDETILIGASGTSNAEPHYGHDLPLGVRLGSNYPDPFIGQTTIPFELMSPDRIDLSVYDTLGRLVRRLVREALDPGHQEIAFDAANLPAGLYFYTLTTPVLRQTRTMVLRR